VRQPTPDGVRVFEVRHIPELDEQGRAVGVLGIARDVTARKRADAALVASERAYRSLAEHTPDFIVRWDRELRRMYVNPAFARTINQLGETVVGTRLGQGYKPQDRSVLGPRAEKLEAAVRRVFETGTRMSMEMQWLERGQLITQDLRIVPEVGAQGEVATVLGIGRDITALKRTERELRTLADNAPDLIARFDPQGRYVFVNKGIERATGIRAESWIGRDVGDVIGLDERGRRIPAFIPLIKLIGSMSIEPRAVDIELELPMGGVESVFDIRLIPELDEQRNLTSILLVARDITERRALEEQLRQAHKMDAIGQLAGGIAHDFNNLLVVILMQTGLASQPDATPEVMRGALEQITEMTERAAHLTTQLLTFSRRQVAQLVDLDLRDIIAKSANVLRGVVGERVAIEVYIRGDLPHVMADAGMIEQILMNLGLNARDAMTSGGQLVVSLETVDVSEKQAAAGPGRRAGPHVCLEVTDTGGGIDPADLPRIFEPFFTTKPAGNGAGLGLATVFGIVQQHKGWIEVESAMNRGTTFRIYFPPAERPTVIGGIHAPPGARAANRGGGETILLVEDDARVRGSVRAMLETYGYRVLDADAPASALLLPDAELDRVALLLTDLVMPGSMTALQLAETLLAKHPRLKVIYMTGYGAEIASKLLSVPGQIVLQKPFAPDDLATCLRRVLDGPVHR
jgi:PAS domain S-box-containing protein